MASIELSYQLRPTDACRPTKVAGRLALGLTALSDGAIAMTSNLFGLLPESRGWPQRQLQGSDVHLLTFFDDLVSVLAIQTRHVQVPEALGAGNASQILQRYESMLAAEDEDVPEDVLAAGDFLVARSVYLPGDVRLLVLDRIEQFELACEDRGIDVPRQEFLDMCRSVLEHFFKEMRTRADSAESLSDLPGYQPPNELVRQGQQWQRRIEALLKRASGEKFAPMLWPW
jgi:hypothetical protein